MPAFVKELFRPDEENEALIDGLLIRHPAYNEIMTALESLEGIPKADLSEHCLLFMADSRTGKTRLLKEYIRRRMPCWTNDGIRIPVLYVLVREAPTVKSLSRLILKEFNEKPSRSDTADDLFDRIVTLCINTGVRCICFDDLHNTIDKNGNVTHYAITTWMKNLATLASLSIVGAGLDRTEELIVKNEQLYNRFDSPLHMPRLDWRIEDHQKCFRGIVRELYKSFERDFELNDQDKTDPFRWYVASGARIGIVVKIARHAVLTARRKGQNFLDRNSFNEAWKKASFKSTRTPEGERPFGPCFESVATDEAIVRVMAAGHEDAPNKATRSPRKLTNRDKKAAVRNAMCR
jgi:hypothetical protein